MGSTPRILTRFGERVRNERLRHNLSQEELGARAGVHRTYVGMIERGEKNITILSIEKLARALGLRVRDLVE
jgi:transcriptional regulator with XRE-family HTH domain